MGEENVIRESITYRFAWPNQAANPVRLLHTAVFFVGLLVPLALAAVGALSLFLALWAEVLWMAISAGTTWLIDAPYVLGASVNMTPTGLVVKRYFVSRRNWAWQDVKSLQLQNQKVWPASRILRHTLLPRSDIPTIESPSPKRHAEEKRPRNCSCGTRVVSCGTRSNT